MRTTIIAALIILVADAAHAAVGCTLENPAQDLKSLFPEMTTYREDAKDLVRRADGKEAYATLRARLGSDLDPIYEAYDTPFTVYSVFAGDKPIGVVHGVNVPGQGGVVQIFVAVDPATVAITSFFFQRIESPAAPALRKKEFRQQFVGLTLADFYKHDYYAAVEPASDQDRIAAVKPLGVPDDGMADFRTTLRGLRKNLILLDLLSFDRRSEPFWQRAQESIKSHAAKPKGE